MQTFRIFQRILTTFQGRKSLVQICSSLLKGQRIALAGATSPRVLCLGFGASSASDARYAQPSRRAGGNDGRHQRNHY